MYGEYVTKLCLTAAMVFLTLPSRLVLGQERHMDYAERWRQALEQGDLAKAMAVLDSELAENPDNARALYGRGVVHTRKDEMGSRDT